MGSGGGMDEEKRKAGGKRSGSLRVIGAWDVGHQYASAIVRK